ncbi:MAG: serine/threonine protein kinase [Planctomycetes bacterium]|nr:serine/threonine protein kinase [Planctomycetota bacterium]
MTKQNADLDENLEASTRESDFGVIALKNGFITQAQLDACIGKQRELSERGEPLSLDNLVIREGYMQQSQVRAVHLARKRFEKEAKARKNLKISGYEILSVLGEGGLGTVYKARQVTMNRVVALKVLHKQWVQDEEFRKRFLLEARIVGKMSHQNLIQVFDVGKEEGYYYFSMEHIDSGTVQDILDSGPMDVRQIVDILIQIARALKYIKDFGLVHRDIKPANMLISRGGVVKLGDFGFVKSHLDKELGYDDMVLGTPDYIAPEQAMGHDVDFRSDIYSLGASFYHMLTGEPPFQGTGSVVMEKHVRESLPDPRSLRKDVPEDVLHVLERMMAKKPEDRYQDFALLFNDLESLKLGQAPKTERLEVGKSTIFRALQHEKTKVDDYTQRIQLLEDQIRDQKALTKILLAVAGVFVVLIMILSYMAFLVD